jgi:hypothetical protein
MLKRNDIIRLIEKTNKTLRNLWYLFFISFIILSSCKSHNLVEKSGQWDQIKYGEYLVENNTWNVQAIKSNWTQTIFYDTSTDNLGWKWDFSSEKDTSNSYSVKSFPEIIFGKKPYENYKSTTSRLPIELKLAKFCLEYEYSVNAIGVYNTSSDISFSDSKNPKSNNIRAKMMIWFNHQNFPFFESEKLIHDTIDGFQYKVFIDTSHIGPEGKWVFIALMSDNFPSKGNLNLKDYFDYFLSRGILKLDWYLSSIEVGSEISSGKGQITFKKFIVH